MRERAIYLETARMLPRGFRLEDAQDLQEILGDRHTMEYMEPAYDWAKTVGFLQSFCMERHGAFAAVHKPTQKAIGYVLLHAQEPGSYEMGWIFHRSYWRKGYAYEICSALISYAFSALDAHKIWAETIDSVKAVGLMRKMGMQPEGVQRKQALDLHGQWQDLHLYGLLREDWAGLTGGR